MPARATPDPPTTIPPTTTPSTTPSKKRKRAPKPSTLHTTTLTPSSTYLHLTLLTPTAQKQPTLTPLTTSHLLTPPLHSYLGLAGSSIPLDILYTRGSEAVIRVPRQDARAVRAGLSSWVGVVGVDVLGLDGDGAEGVGGGGGKVKVAWRVKSVGGCVWEVDDDDGGRNVWG